MLLSPCVKLFSALQETNAMDLRHENTYPYQYFVSYLLRQNASLRMAC